MSNLFRNLASRGGLSFAHLNGLNAKAAKAEDDKPEDEDKKEDAKAEGDEPDEKDDEKKDAKRADDGDDDKKDAKAEDDKPDEEDDKKDAKADDGDDDSDEEMRGKSAVAQARLREQARCASIFASKAAARNPVLAANLAFNTRMTRQEALAVLESTPAAASAAHADRAARNPNIGTNGAKQSPQQATAARWDANLKAANPSRR